MRTWGEGAIRQRNFDVGTVANCIQVVGTICGNVVLCHNKTVNCVCMFSFQTCTDAQHTRRMSKVSSDTKFIWQ